MTGIFTVQVMNWMGDIQHFERSIAFDDNKPVEVQGTSGNWGKS